MLVSEFHTPVRRAHGGSGVRVGNHQIAPLIDLDEGRFELTLTQFQHQGLESLDSNMFDPLVNVSQLEFFEHGNKETKRGALVGRDGRSFRRSQCGFHRAKHRNKAVRTLLSSVVEGFEQ